MATTQKQVNIPMTPEQVKALRDAAKQKDTDMASLVRSLLHTHIQDYPDNMPQKGKYSRDR